MNTKIIIGAVVAAIVAIVGSFFVGQASVDPKASDEYNALSKTLTSTKAHLKDTQGELELTETSLSTTEDNLSDAEAQVDALTSELPSNSADGGTEPAVSDGAAVAPRNFKLGVRIRSKECFGSAGCNVTVQIDPDYVGNQDVSSGSWEITYELRGLEDGPVIETMTLESGTFSFPEEQSVGTTSSNSQITAVVTEVYALN